MTPDQILSELQGGTIAELFVGNGNMLRLTIRKDSAEISLRTWGCPWQLRDTARLLAASGDVLEKGPIAPQLVGSQISEVCAEEIGKSLTIRIGSGAHLSCFVTESEGDEYSFQWSIHPAGEHHLMVRAGGRWAVESENEAQGPQHQ